MWVEFELTYWEVQHINHYAMEIPSKMFLKISKSKYIFGLVQI